MAKKEEIKISSNPYEIWCAWCKVAHKGIAKDCDYCFKTVTLPQVEIKYAK